MRFQFCRCLESKTDQIDYKTTDHDHIEVIYQLSDRFLLKTWKRVEKCRKTIWKNKNFSKKLNFPSRHFVGKTLHVHGQKQTMNQTNHRYPHQNWITRSKVLDAQTRSTYLCHTLYVKIFIKNRKIAISRLPIIRKWIGFLWWDLSNPGRFRILKPTSFLNSLKIAVMWAQIYNLHRAFPVKHKIWTNFKIWSNFMFHRKRS
jgi:hypothetical protein